MNTFLPNHILYTDLVIKRMMDLDTIPSDEDKDLYRICMYLITKSDYDSDRDIFVMSESVELIEAKYKDADKLPAVLSSLTGVNYKCSDEFEQEEKILKIGSILAANKSPETFTIISACDEYEGLMSVKNDKNYSVKVHRVKEILNLCGVDYPFRPKFHGQIKNFEKRNTPDSE